MSWLLNTKIPTKWKKLTTWWPDCSRDISWYNSENWLQRHRNKLILELKINCTWNNQDDADQTTAWPILRWVSELTVSVRNPLPSPIKDLAHWLSEVGSQPLDRSLPLLPHPTLVAGLWNKANFPFHQHHHFIDFWAAISWIPTFSNNTLLVSLRGLFASKCLIHRYLTLLYISLLGNVFLWINVLC